MRLPLFRAPVRTGLPDTEHGLVAVDGFAIPYRIVRSARRRRTIELRVERDGVRIAAPLRTSVDEIEAFVRSRTDWIQRQVSTQPTEAAQATLGSATTVPYLGRPIHVEHLEAHGLPRHRIRVHLDLLGLRVQHPPLPAEERAEAIGRALRDWYRARAVEELPRRTAAWAMRAGLEPPRVLVRDQKRRWGSCAPDGTIRLNWRLMMLDPRLVDYVVAHEVAHLRHPHHQRTFWAEVGRLMPDYRDRRRALREAARSLPAS